MKTVSGALILCALTMLGLLAAFFLSRGPSVEYVVNPEPRTVEPVALAPVVAEARDIEARPATSIVSHLETPEPLKAIYMTSWIAGTPSLRERVLRLVRETEVNAIVIDVKDDTGRITFAVEDPALLAVGSAERRIRDLRELIARLHEEQVYVIARVAVFQDPYLAAARPELAVKGKDGSIWRDRKGLSWLDAGSREVWEYVVAIGKEAHAAGFDEINFDYVRFPSDGKISETVYPLSEGRERREVMREFFAYITKAFQALDIPISADVFGQITTDDNDLGIGQYLEDVLPYFDYISPMVYPSHYADGFIGLPHPAAEPYEVVRYSMDRAVERARRLEEFGPIATTTKPTIAIEDCKLCQKLRPWLQDFDLGADYTAEMVRAQIKATNDAGLSSWLLWDPGNHYTRGALTDIE
jgi:hypothetical protein